MSDNLRALRQSRERADWILTNEFWARRPPALKLRRATFAVQSLAPPTEAAPAAQVGGARRDRTDDLLLAKQALSQLSYGPFRDQVSVISKSRQLRGLLITDF